MKGVYVVCGRRGGTFQGFGVPPPFDPLCWIWPLVDVCHLTC